MCNCSKPITQTDCQRLKECLRDPERRTFIYHIFNDERGLKIACVQNGFSPKETAQERNFYNENGELEFYHVSEHPCHYE